MLYKKFCCSLYIFLRDHARSDIPLFATYMFTVFLFILLAHAIDSLCFLFFKTPYVLKEWVVYLLSGVFGLFNYFLVFKNRSFLKYEHDRLHPVLMFFIVVLIFGGSLGLILCAGPRNIPVSN